MLAAMAALVVIFSLLALTRVGGARRAQWIGRWPAVSIGALSAFLLMRGRVRSALVLALIAVLIWLWMARAERKRTSNPAPSMAEQEARALLGVGPRASAEEIRASFRTKMAQHHPDRGGSKEMAARLVAARDLLLKK